MCSFMVGQYVVVSLSTGLMDFPRQTNEESEAWALPVRRPLRARSALEDVGRSRTWKIVFTCLVSVPGSMISGGHKI